MILSEQNNVDCNPQPGCNGGWPTKAIAYARDNGVSESIRYKYVARNNRCKRTQSMYPPGEFPINFKIMEKFNLL
jgi:hypothetical protein